jgi:hypothetical protein
MIHREELLEDWRLCWENRSSAKIEPLGWVECCSMYWDVVEVRPEQDYCVFLRFKDGLTGRVQLRPEELTGVLAPLRDERFFEQVFIDCGAVAWPGEIDLAPDAMYAKVASQRHESE